MGHFKKIRDSPLWPNPIRKRKDFSLLLIQKGRGRISFSYGMRSCYNGKTELRLDPFSGRSNTKNLPVPKSSARYFPDPPIVVLSFTKFTSSLGVHLERIVKKREIEAKRISDRRCPCNTPIMGFMDLYFIISIHYSKR